MTRGERRRFQPVENVDRIGIIWSQEWSENGDQHHADDDADPEPSLPSTEELPQRLPVISGARRNRQGRRSNYCLRIRWRRELLCLHLDLLVSDPRIKQAVAEIDDQVDDD